MVYQNGKSIAVSLASSGEYSSVEDIYSTEEEVIGRWIDGKPLYRKVYIGNGTFKKGTELNATMEHGFRSNKHLVYAYGNICMHYTATIEYDYGLPIAVKADKYSVIIVTDDGNLNLVSMWDANGTGPFEIVVVYTKNADQATIELSSMLSIQDIGSLDLHAYSAPASSAKELTASALGEEV